MIADWGGAFKRNKFAGVKMENKTEVLHAVRCFLYIYPETVPTYLVHAADIGPPETRTRYRRN